MSYLLDTNIITALLKGDEKVKDRAQGVILSGMDIFINGISYYEIKRGLLASGATKKLELFDNLCKKFGLILFDTEAIFDEGARIYAYLKKGGKPIGDADILIASLAKTKDFILVSNDKHFQRIHGLRVENWLM